MDSPVQHFLVKDLRHIIIERRHNLIRSLNQADIQAYFMEVFSYFYADEASAHNHDMLAPILRYIVFQPTCVCYITNCEHVGILYAFDISWPYRIGSWSQDKLIIGFLIFCSRLQIFYEHAFFFPQDVHDFPHDMYVNVVAFFEVIRGHHNQGFLFLYGISQIIGKTAI